MSPQSHGQLLLISQYRQVLRRDWARAAQAAAGIVVEPLPPRRLFAVTPLGPEVQANQTTAEHEISADVAVAPDGSFVVAWESDANVDGSNRGVMARRFAADGTPLTVEFGVNVTTQNNQTDPSIAMDDAGNFVIAWVSDHADNDDIFVRRFDAAAAPIGGETRVNTYTASDQMNPDVGVSAGGAFVVAWEGEGANDGDGVWAQRFVAGGGASGANFRVNGLTGSKQFNPSVDLAADGSFVVTHSDDSTHKVMAQRYTAGGVGQGQFAVDGVSGLAGNEEKMSSVAVADNGNFVVAWSNSGASSRVVYRRYAANGAALSAPARVAPLGTKEQSFPRVAVSGSGAFAVVWQDHEIDGDSTGAGAAFFNADGSTNGPAFAANTYVAHDQEMPAVAVNGSRVVIAWGRESALDSEGIVARRFSTARVPVALWNAENNALDSVGSHHGTPTNGAGYAAGRVGAGAFAFDGLNDYVQVGPAATLKMTTAVTTDAWIYPTQAWDDDEGGIILNKEGEYEVTRYGDGQIRAAFARPNGTWVWLDSGYYAPADAWTHVAVTFDNGNVRMYVNGAQVASHYNGATTIADVNPSLNDLRIGGRQGNAAQHFQGRIDKASVYDVALTPAEIAQLHAEDAATGNSAPGLSYAPSNDLLTISEDPATNAGTLVSALIANEYHDADPGALRGIAVTAAAAHAGGTWQFTLDGTTWLDFNAPAATAARLLAADANTRIRFAPNANYNGTITNGLTFRAWDQTSGTVGGTADTTTNGGQTAFSTATSSPDVTITAVNDAPLNTVPAGQTTPEDTGLVFSSAGGNAISITDADAGTDAVSVTLSVTSGRLTLASTSGLSFSQGDGVNDGTMTFGGRASAINAALNGLSYAPAANASGTFTLTLTTNDLGNNGAGGAKSDADTVSINVTAVNDAPVNHLPPTQSVSGGSVLNLGSGTNTAISVSDVDGGAAPVRVSLVASLGTLTLATTAGLSFTSGDGTNDASLTFSGTRTAVNAALDGMQYNPPTLLLGNAYIAITSDDQGATGAGGAKTDSDTLTVGVSPANQAPVNDVPSTQHMSEDGNLVFSASGGNGITVNDADAGSGDVRVTLTASSGVISLANTDGLTFLSGDGNGDAATTIRGTLANINNALEGLVYTPPANSHSSASIQIVTNDLGNSGAGGARSDTDSFGIQVASVNDAPVLEVPSARSTTEDTPRKLSPGNSSKIEVTDADPSGSYTVAVTGTGGTITLGSTAGLSFATGDGAGDAAVTFVGTLAEINAAFSDLIFTPNPGFHGDGTIDIEVTEGGGGGNGGGLADSGTVIIHVDSVNDAPVVTAPAAAQAVAEDATIVLSTANGNGVVVADEDLDGGSIRVTVAAANGLVTLSNTAGLSFVAGDGSADATMTFTATLAAANAALEGLNFIPAAQFTGAASITITANDQGHSGAGGAKSHVQTVAVNVDPVNDAPVNNLPAAQTVNEDGVLTFSTGGGNAIGVTDLDAGAGVMRVTLAATHGTLTLATLAGLNFVAGDGAGDATLTFDGTRGSINAALNGMTFAPDANYVGAAAIQITSDDGGHSGSGGAKGDVDALAMTVVAVNDAPTAVAAPADVSVQEDAGPTTVNVVGSFADIDSATLSYLVTGNTNAALFDSVTLDPVSGDLVVKYKANAFGQAEITIRAVDAGNLKAEVTLKVAAAAVNDAPAVTKNAALKVAAAGQAGKITSALLKADDVDDAAAQVKFTIVTLPSGGGIKVGTTALGVGGTFTQADLDAGRVTYGNTNKLQQADSFSFTVSDAAGATTATTTFKVELAAEASSGGTGGGPVTPPQSPPPPPPPPPPNQPPEVDTGNEDEEPEPVVRPTSPLPRPTPPKSTTKSQPASSGTVGGGAEPAPAPASGGSDAAPAKPAAPPQQVASAAPTPAPPPPAEAQPQEQSAPPQPPQPEAPAPAPQPVIQRAVAGANGLASASGAPAVVPITPAPAPVAAPVLTSEDVAFVAAPSGVMTQTLDQLREQITQPQNDALKLVAGTAVVSLGLSVGYVFWILRAGYLLTSMLSSMPAWQFVDPLPILNDASLLDRRRRRRTDGETDEDESLETMVDHANEPEARVRPGMISRLRKE